MKNIKILNISLSLLMMVFFASCFKEDEKIYPQDSGESEFISASIGEAYSKYAYMDIKSSTVTATGNVDLWDLSFNNSDDLWTVRINTSKLMKVARTSESFDSFLTVDGLEFSFDGSDGSLETNAIGEWWSNEGGQWSSKDIVYVVDRGRDFQGNQLGYKKIQLDIVDDNYVIRYANLDGTDDQQLTISKDKNYVARYLEFDNGIVDVEPMFDNWSIRFSRYLTTLYGSDGEELEYAVTGAWIHPDYQVALDSNDFYQFTIADTVNIELTSKQDFIGHEWKLYGFDDGLYLILENRNYILKTPEGYFYKMRFLDFYHDGHKGNIFIESVRL